MSKQSQANVIVKQGQAAGLDRQTMIDEICAQTEAGPGYAATLYAKAAKAAKGSTPATQGTKKPKAPVGNPAGKMTSFTNANMDKIRNEVDEALAAINAKYGITVETGNIRYNSDRMSFKLGVTAAVGGKEDANKNMWNSYCHRYGLKAEDFGKSFRSNGVDFTISGIKPRGKKYNVLAKNPSGQTYKFEAERVKRLIK